MSIRLLNSVDNTIPAKQLKDGQIAVITRWGVCTSYAGRIVQRYKEHLVVLGLPSGNSWPNFFREGSHGFDDCRVWVLPNGDAQFEIKDNN